jgi:hypothetical protein
MVWDENDNRKDANNDLIEQKGYLCAICTTYTQST